MGLRFSGQKPALKIVSFPGVNAWPQKGNLMKSPLALLRIAFLASAVLLCAASLAYAQDNYASVKLWESFDFAHSKVTSAQMNSLPLDELKLVRGIVFGKHGRIFKDFDIRLYLNSRDWYHAKPDFRNSSLNNTERDNLDVIRIAEAQKHETVQPGDMRLY